MEINGHTVVIDDEGDGMTEALRKYCRQELATTVHGSGISLDATYKVALAFQAGWKARKNTEEKNGN